MRSTFVTDSGITVPAVTTNQMRELDRVAVEGPGPSLQQMMENAGRTLAELVVASEPIDDVVVLAGPGNNGGGGICAARHLANRGVATTLVVAATARPGTAARQQLDLYRETGSPVVSGDDLARVDATMIVDALIGYGLSGPPRGEVLGCIEWIDASTAAVISLDVPSGLDATAGTAPGAVVTATRTLTLALPKTGLDAAQVGELWLADLGIPAGVYRAAGLDVGVAFAESPLVRLRPGTPDA